MRADFSEPRQFPFILSRAVSRESTGLTPLRPIFPLAAPRLLKMEILIFMQSDER